MKIWQKLLLKLIATIITFIVVYLLVSSAFTIDFSTSLEPGWHTTIKPFGSDFKLTLIILFSALLIYFLFKYLLKGLTIIWAKLFSLHP